MHEDLRRLLGGWRSAEAVGDAALLNEFVCRRQGEAFAALVAHLGPLVVGVCRRILPREHDVEDAFQATFLILARKAHTIRRQRCLAGWLARVARRVAWNVRAQQGQEQLPQHLGSGSLRSAAADSEPARQAERRELAAVIDEEVGRLPGKYRSVVILCDLLGRTHAQAARELGRPLGSIARHLERGRELLRERLGRRGLAPGATVLAVLVADSGRAAVPAAWVQVAAAASVPASAGSPLPDGLISARAVALSQGVIQAMRIKELSVLVFVFLALGLVTAGAGLAAWSALDRTSTPAQALPAPAAAQGNPAPAPAQGDQAPAAIKVEQVPPAGPKTPAEPQLQLKAKGPATPLAPGETMSITITLSTTDDGLHTFLLGSIPQVFGIYVTGPKGPIPPDPTKVLPANWMHQQHSAAVPITVSKGNPWRLTLALGDYFPVGDANKFVAGAYQVTVKFHDMTLGMKTAIEAGPVRFEIKGAPRSAEEAIATFQVLAREAAAKAQPDARRQLLESRLGSTIKLKAVRQSFKEALARLHDTLTPAEMPNFIVHGAPVNVPDVGDCWTIESFGSGKSEVVGYLDAATGRLVLLWIVPEG
jgi:RNA polymerase sigma factor (sigma-70 family)